ncbi:UNVERIFIED_CONTAM: hypothetical protein FKN15_046253 [Acipenser sinensis]
MFPRCSHSSHSSGELKVQRASSNPTTKPISSRADVSELPASGGQSACDVITYEDINPIYALCKGAGSFVQEYRRYALVREVPADNTVPELTLSAPMVTPDVPELEDQDAISIAASWESGSLHEEEEGQVQELTFETCPSRDNL